MITAVHVHVINLRNPWETSGLQKYVETVVIMGLSLSIANTFMYTIC